MSHFNILLVLKESIVMPFTNLKGLLGSIALMGIWYLIVTAVLDLSFGNALSRSFGDGANSSVLGSLKVTGMLIVPVFFVAIVGGMIIVGVLFNYWVRYAAFGLENAIVDDRGVMVKTAFYNSLKMIFVGIFVSIMMSIMMVVILAFFTGTDLTEFGTIMQSKLIPSLLALNLFAIALICFLYAVMSGSLTRTALGFKYKEPINTHVKGFAVVLLLIYIPLTIISSISLAFLGVWVSMIVQTILGAWVYLSIASAHGVRHRLCLAEDANYEK